MVALVLGIVWPPSSESSAAFLVPPHAPGSESVEDAIIAIVDAGRKDFTPCVLVEKPDYPGSRHAPAWLFEDQENDTAPERV
jgi:hypothetical protein